jgi:hypothetical protein
MGGHRFVWWAAAWGVFASSAGCDDALRLVMDGHSIGAQTFGATGTVQPAGATCSPANLTGRCPSGQTCVAGACCATEQACGGSCCSPSALCTTDTNGNRVCSARCTSSSQCPGAAPTRCCLSLRGPSGTTLPYGVCSTAAADGSTACLCERFSDCVSASCTPSLRSNGMPTRPFVCSRPNCGPYGRCFTPNSTPGTCEEDRCLVMDTRGNFYCAPPCLTDAQCPGAVCLPYAGKFGRCLSQRACFPR